MAELPLSHFAPFDKYESNFQPEVMPTLKELNVQCAGCIYYDKSHKIVNKKPTEDGPMSPTASDRFYDYDFKDGQELYHCTIFREGNDYVAPHSLCRFFTPIETEEESEDEELSIALQKLDFTNSNIIENINQLRDKLIND